VHAVESKGQSVTSTGKALLSGVPCPLADVPAHELHDNICRSLGTSCHLQHLHLRCSTFACRHQSIQGFSRGKYGVDTGLLKGLVCFACNMAHLTPQLRKARLSMHASRNLLLVN
jgi:hypothetical protein